MSTGNEQLDAMFAALGMTPEDVDMLIAPTINDATKRMSHLISLAACRQDDLLINIFENDPDMQNIGYVKMLLGLTIETLAGKFLEDPNAAAMVEATKKELDEKGKTQFPW